MPIACLIGLKLSNQVRAKLSFEQLEEKCRGKKINMKGFFAIFGVCN